MNDSAYTLKQAQNLADRGYMHEAAALLQGGDPDDFDTALLLAYCYINIDTRADYQRAADCLWRVRAAGERSNVWHYRYSCALVYVGRMEEAAAHAERAAALADADFPWGWLQAIRMRYRRGDAAGALAGVEEGLKLAPGDYEFLTHRADILAGKPFEVLLGHYIKPEEDQQTEALDRAARLTLDDEIAPLAYEQMARGVRMRLDVEHAGGLCADALAAAGLAYTAETFARLAAAVTERERPGLLASGEAHADFDDAQGWIWCADGAVAADIGRAWRAAMDDGAQLAALLERVKRDWDAFERHTPARYEQKYWNFDG